MITLNLPHYTGSDASEELYFSAVTVPAQATVIQTVAGQDLGVTLICRQAVTLKVVFTIWTTSNTLSNNTLNVVILVGNNPPSFWSFTNIANSQCTFDGTTYYAHSTQPTWLHNVSSGTAVTASWHVGPNRSLDAYNAVLSVVAVDWGDGLTLPGNT